MAVRTELHGHEDGCDHGTGGDTDEEDGWSLSDAMPLENEALKMGIDKGEKLGRIEGLEMGVETGRKTGEEIATEMGFYRGVAVALLTLSTGAEVRAPVVSSRIVNRRDGNEAEVLAEEIMGPLVDESLTEGKGIHSPEGVHKVKLAVDEGSCEMRNAGVKRRGDDVGTLLVVPERARKALIMVCQLAVSAVPNGDEKIIDSDNDVTAGLEACRIKFRAAMSMLRCPIRYKWEMGKPQGQTLSF